MTEFSLIIPVYNRPQEVEELLESLTKQREQNFEVIIVEDGSKITCENVVEKYKNRLTLHYYVKTNGGPGPARNYGAKRSCGKYLIFLDSDCIIPPGYMQATSNYIEQSPETDAFGGPDRADNSFTNIQKAINYSMTSFLTTGGIRGKNKRMKQFHPRSFNMGIRREVFELLNGFAPMRFGEDIDFSIRIIKNGCSCKLFPKSWVYHKRRTSFRQFFKQVHNSGIARITLYKKYPDSLKAVHTLPTLFTVGLIILLLASIICPYALIPILIFILAIFADASIQNKSIRIGLLSIIASIIQLTGYGSGFIAAWWKMCVLHHKSHIAFENNFYK